ncbi:MULTISPECIES: hypothetical protein [Clostridium]|jgi:hypothetical protein|uniref:ATP synthase subunit I n=3 Tax=Clostridium TaxID=1485 RepID=A0AAE5LSN6_CLOBE|nr:MULTISPECIES: hypothetical protein [Clostridium]ALB48229.1 hypothetical protein X276_24600 [Clostridium beijerinckii NRRL B-598]AVK49524.1 hypothetical protein AXY43_16905 [Clostridium sp. MF28]MBC2458026.1 hypothetical protein [Clostridium beijerinckii]MBC2476355.1 hypothetical protein [Clostridium beijerinckii]MBE6090413.1 hypothetical protein [Clostridium beijerinckii]
MNKEVNKLLLQTIKYDLGSGLLISLIIVLISTFINAGIYMIGMCVSLINFLASGYIVGKFLDKNRAWIIIPTYFIRMAFIIATIFPFLGNMEYVIYYMIGFVSHYVLLIVFRIKENRKGSV